jgi:ligand-binding sensor domain-containing protein/signal transduction histidine kinase
MLHLFKIVFIFLLITIVVNQSFAQPAKIKFDQIGLEQGLSQSTVNAIVQDKYGFMWFGTQDGLNRYDGYSIKTFKHDPIDSNSISNNKIQVLLSDKSGNLWIGTESGLNKYGINENRFYHYFQNTKEFQSINENNITSLFEDSNNSVWVGTAKGGLYYCDGSNNSFKLVFHLIQDSSSKDGISLKTICEDDHKNLWFAGTGVLYKLNLDDVTQPPLRLPFIQHNLFNKNIRVLYFNKKGILYIGIWGEGLYLLDQNKKGNEIKLMSTHCKYITSIYEDSKNPESGLWIGSYDGLNFYKLKDNKFDKYISGDIMCLYRDNSDILWIGTFAKGIQILNKQKYRFAHYLNTLAISDIFTSDQEYMVSAFLIDDDGELWVSTWGNGLYRFDRDKKVIKNYRFDPKNNGSIGSNYIYTICESSAREIWIATRSGGLNSFNKKSDKFIRYNHNINDENSISSDDVSALYVDEITNTVWMGYSKGGISSYNISENKFKHFLPDENNPNAISGTPVTVIFNTKLNGLLVGTIRGGLNKFIPETESFKHINLSINEVEANTNNQGSIQKKDNNSINAIYEDDDGILWLGTSGGLTKYDSESNSFIYYTTRDGLPNNVIYGILSDKSGNLWLSTNKGISRFNPGSESFKNFDVSDGLQAKEYNQGAYFISDNGEMFFGGVNGFNSFFPDEIEDNKFIPPIYLTTFSIFNETLNLPDPIPDNYTIELSYFQNFFSFEFVALNFTSSKKNQYAYILEGFDGDWHYVSAQQRYASYTNLNPGEYKLKVKGSNNDGIWNEEGTQVSIIVRPTFWMTWWFRISIAIAILGLIIFIYKYRVKQLLRIEQMRVKIASDLHDEIGSSIGSIVLRSRVLQKELSKNPEKTGWTNKSKEELQRIYHTASQVAAVMRDIVWFINPGFDKVDDMILRMKDTAQNLLSETHYDFFAPNEILTSKLTLDFRRNIFLSYKEVLHNIVKHSKATKVIIRVSISNGILYLEISDNGIGFDTFKHWNSGISEGTGLKNLRKRMEVINGTINIQSAHGTGTKVIIGAKTT